MDVSIRELLFVIVVRGSIIIDAMIMCVIQGSEMNRFNTGS